MGIISWIIFGLIAGILAKWIMPGKDGGGFIITVILGIIGAVVGGWISTFFGFAVWTGSTSVASLSRSSVRLSCCLSTAKYAVNAEHDVKKGPAGDCGPFLYWQ